jgi:predicted DNA-binding transcriptional regulator YafY
MPGHKQDDPRFPVFGTLESGARTEEWLDATVADKDLTACTSRERMPEAANVIERPNGYGRRPAGPRYGRGESLLALAIALQGSRAGLTLADMAALLKERENPHGRRTVERMRDAIERLCPGFECVNPTERPLRYRIDAPSGISIAHLNQVDAKDLAGLDTAARLLDQSNLREQADTVRRVAAALKAMLPTAQRRRVEPDLELLMQAEGIALRPGPRVVIPPEKMRIFRDAILGCRRLKIVYKARGTKLESRQVVEPYAIVYGQRPYLLAINVGLGKLSYWSLTNVLAVEPLDRTFRRRKSFSLQKYLERSFGVFQEKPSKVVWRFDKEVADEAAQFAFHPTQKMRRLKDGRLEVRFKAGGRQEMAWHLATWNGLAVCRDIANRAKELKRIRK